MAICIALLLTLSTCLSGLTANAEAAGLSTPEQTVFGDNPESPPDAGQTDESPDATSEAGSSEPDPIEPVVEFALPVSGAGLVLPSESGRVMAPPPYISGTIWSIDEDMIGYIEEGRIAEHAQPVPGYTVYLYTADDWADEIDDNRLTTITDEDGIYVFTGLEPGDYVVGLYPETLGGAEYSVLLIEDANYQCFGYGQERATHMAFSNPITLQADEAVENINGGLLRVLYGDYNIFDTIDMSNPKNKTGTGFTITAANNGSINNFDPNYPNNNQDPNVLSILSFTPQANNRVYHLTQSRTMPNGTKKGTCMIGRIEIRQGTDTTIIITDIDLLGYIILEHNAKLILVLEGTNHVRQHIAVTSAYGETCELTIKSFNGLDNGNILDIDPTTLSIGVAGLGGGNARIGGNQGTNAGKITIESGTLNLKTFNQNNLGAATGAVIGGGGSDSYGYGQSRHVGDGGDITINGGTINITSTTTGAAIGGGGSWTRPDGNFDEAGNGGNITINGGTITINHAGFNGGSASGACIGGGGSVSAVAGSVNGGIGGNILITDGKLNLTLNTLAAVIGAGSYGAPGNITITDGNITARSIGSSAGGAAIGGCNGTSTRFASTINISGGEITAESVGTGIGLMHGSATCHIIISGGTINAKGAEGPGIGFFAAAVAGADTITITGGTVVAQNTSTNATAAGIGGNIEDNALPYLVLGPDADVIAYSRGTGLNSSSLSNSAPAIWVHNDSKITTGYYVNASYVNGAPSSNQATKLIVTQSGSTAVLRELTLPANYRHFAYSTGTTTIRNDNIRASRAGGAYRNLVRDSDSDSSIPSILITSGYSNYSGVRGALPVREGTDQFYIITQIHVYTDGTNLALVNPKIIDTTTNVNSGGNYTNHPIDKVEGFAIAGYKVDNRPNTSGSDFTTGTTATISGTITSNRTVYFVYGDEATYNYRYWVYSSVPANPSTFINSKHWLADAVALCVSQPNSQNNSYTIVLALGNDPDVSDNHDNAVTIPAGMKITLTSTKPAPEVSTRHTITQIRNVRHLIVRGQLTLDNIVLEGQGYSFTNNNPGSICNGGIEVQADGTLTMNDNAVIQKCFTNVNNDYAGAAVVVRNRGVFRMTGGLISSNEAVNGAAVYSEGNNSGSGEFIMSGGTISDNKATPFYVMNIRSGGYGGAVLVDGTATMNGGTISANSAVFGGGVSIGTRVSRRGTFTMNGGSISGNTADDAGGGVIMHSNTTFTMNSGTIGGASNGNTATGYGGGVRVDGGALIMINGAISYNQANIGGGVDLENGTARIENGAIEYNNARNSLSSQTSAGGGVFIRTGTFTMNGGSISYNRELEEGYGGGGVFIDPPASATASFTMTGGSISNNSGTRGGGVLDWGVGSCTFTMTGGSITANKSEGTVAAPNQGNGGGVGLYGDATFYYRNGTIDNNSATNNGGGIWVGDIATLRTGYDDGSGAPTITNNRAPNGNGGGIYTELTGSYANITISAGTEFSGNTAKTDINIRRSFAWVTTNYTTIKSDSHSTCPGFSALHPLNNYDINAVQRVTILSLSKKVVGNYSDTNKLFNFTLRFSAAADGTGPLSGSFDYYDRDPLATGSIKLGTLTLNSSGTATIALKHGQTICLDAVPTNCHVRIVEDDYSNLHYAPSFTDSGRPASLVTPISGASTGAMAMSTDPRSIDFTNDRSGIPIVGVETGSLSALLPLSILAVVVLLAWLVGSHLLKTGGLMKSTQGRHFNIRRRHSGTKNSDSNTYQQQVSASQAIADCGDSGAPAAFLLS